jgi:hypothetical protein
MTGRRQLGRVFELAAVKLVMTRGVSAAQAASASGRAAIDVHPRG